ncbi:aspartate-alanine antiporter [Bradyrhizobium xenonodulans]|uniref:Aspartate-alanine antiporter n=1 Tax=Bradyrhizobium xenonodulans TaxID=2736875 RepID=A0ABY7MCA4_9BRAD|nr:TrkA C-terminal domain-containing protein [Bradyrhizobium xenonodulans]WBL75481.1 aspartate-alanine antiporter [Bradyrhizobium xenonodulans]
METFADLLRSHPELALFLSVIFGHLIGRFHFKGVGFGNVVGTLLAGIIIGIFAKPLVPDLLRWSFFYLFLFAIGYSVGPQFFGSLKRNSLPQVALAVVVAATGLATTIAMSVLFDFDEGTTLGLLTGGLTTSAALGTGISAINSLPIPADLKATLAANAPLADAITYGFGDVGVILFLTVVGPRLMRIDLKSEAEALEAKLAAFGRDDQVLSGRFFGVRAYRVVKPGDAVLTVRTLEDRFSSGRLAVQRVKREDKLLQVQSQLALHPGDAIVIAARIGVFSDIVDHIGPEITDDPELLSVPQTSASIVVTRRAGHGKSLADLGAATFARGIYLESLRRGHELLPREAWTVIERGDVLRIVGTPEDVERAAAHIGFMERDLDKTDLAFIAGGISLGILMGLPKLVLYGVPVGLGLAGAILLVGLVAGWARGRYPVFGAIPQPAQRLLADLGLIVFIAGIGLTSGPHAMEALHRHGVGHFASIFLAGMVVTLVPPLVGLAFARLVKMNPIMILGGIAGAQTCPPALTALREVSGSNVAALAYTVPYALGYIIITMWGAVVVAIMHAIRA